MEQTKYTYMVRVNCVTYNHAAYIEDAMDGFCMQETSFPFVCTIVDDASNDGEQEVIKKYMQEHFNLDDISVFRKEETDDYILTFAQHKTNENCYFAVLFLKYNHRSINKPKKKYLKEWNETSKYIALCEGDDYWIDSQKLQKQVNFLEKNPSYVMSHTGIRYFYEYERKFYDSKDIEINTNIQKMGLTKEKILSGYRIQYASVVVHSKFFYKARQLDPFLFCGYFLMGDTQLWYNLFKIGKIHFLPETTCVYRKNEGSATRNTSVAKSLRFSLSSKELRLYLARKDNLSPIFQKKVNKEYELALKKYMYFNPNFIPYFPLPTYCPSTLLNTFIVPFKKMYLVFFLKYRGFLGYMRRIGKKRI